MPQVFRRVLCRAVAFAIVLVAVRPLVVRPADEPAKQSGPTARSAKAFAPAFMPEEFAARRAKIYESVGDDLALLFGADDPQDFRRPRQHNNFYYVTGMESPGLTVLLDGRAKETTVFAAPSSTGAAQAEAKRVGIERVRPAGEFADTVRRVAEGRKRVFLPRWPGEGNAQARDSFRPPVSQPAEFPGDRRPTRIQDFRDGVLALTGPLEVVALETVLDPMRRVKSPAEIAAMREAGRIGAEAIADAVRATRPGIVERELEGVCELAFLRNGAQASAWTTIVATGPNIIDFHYFANTRRIEPGDMILVDAGPDYQYYTSDITRVWPASGPYPPRYRELYDKLLVVHRATVEAVKPGATIQDLGKVMMETARREGIGNFVYPNPGHYTGMAPHDVGDRRAALVPGVCFNVEPLLVVQPERLHIRFEDTVLCTETGYEVLTPLDVLPWEADKLLEMRGR